MGPLVPRASAFLSRLFCVPPTPTQRPTQRSLRTTSTIPPLIRFMNLVYFYSEGGYFIPREGNRSLRQGDLGEMSSPDDRVHGLARQGGKEPTPCEPCRRGWGSGGLTDFKSWLCSQLAESPGVGQAGREACSSSPLSSLLCAPITWAFTAKLVAQLMVPTSQEEHSVLLGDREEGRVSRTFHSISPVISALGHT